MAEVAKIKGERVSEPKVPLDSALNYVFSRKHAMDNTRPFCDPAGVACGVYLVFDARKTTCIYVGSSVQLSNRLRNGWHMPPEAPTFAFQVPSLLLRDVEASYWLALNPPLNKKSPPGGADEDAAAAIALAWKRKSKN